MSAYKSFFESVYIKLVTVTNMYSCQDVSLSVIDVSWFYILSYFPVNFILPTIHTILAVNVDPIQLEIQAVKGHHLQISL